ncbi:hypothetical protein BIY26_00250 [Brenneria goodwinii]|uniref:Uncharacterized protein n=1 Tax=Brenneria goodwinii TaxID=1109412 RepID=A0AAE8JQ39_9GAMM|nr:hypothetical protein [Brenneria goodwinii]ATA24370.1 hypothetical protein AWC36_09710 [Brenneria goodwinii]RLM29488.1 hypothetical protein BIY26_00250 [Brenneria goodwinii]
MTTEELHAFLRSVKGKNYLSKVWTTIDENNTNSKFSKDKYFILGVKFGLTGDGERPNYQLELSNGKSITYRGDNHKPYNKTEFLDGNISDNISLDILKKYRFTIF